MGMPQVMDVDGRHTCFYGIAFQIITIYSLRVCENPLRRLHKVFYIVLHLFHQGGRHRHHTDAVRCFGSGYFEVVTLPVDSIMLLLILMVFGCKIEISRGERQQFTDTHSTIKEKQVGKFQLGLVNLGDNLGKFFQGAKSLPLLPFANVVHGLGGVLGKVIIFHGVIKERIQLNIYLPQRAGGHKGGYYMPAFAAGHFATAGYPVCLSH